MRDSRLIDILKTFSKAEWKLFEKFAASPFFNNGRNYLPILKLLQKDYPKFDNDKLTYENMYSKLYPGKSFKKQVMWNIASELEKLSKEFLLQSALKENKIERFTLIFDVLLQRKLDKLTIKEIEETEKYINKTKLGPEYFRSKRIIEDDKSEYWNTIKGRQDRSFESIFQGTEYFILNVLIDVSTQVWDLHIIKKMYNPIDDNIAYEFIKNLEFKKIIDYALEKEYKYGPLMMFYYNKIMCALDENNSEYFFKMKKYFEENSDLFDIKEQKNTIITLANYAANKMRLGDDYYLRTLFEINKLRLEKGTATLGNGRINKALYHQILRSALALNEINWAEDFVKEYTSKLNIEFQKTMFALANGYISYVKKGYREVLSYLSKVEFIDIRDKLHVRILSAKAYYELNEIEVLLSYIDSSKHFISSNLFIEDSTRESYLRFFNYLHKLIQQKENNQPSEYKKMKNEILADGVLRLRHREWFIEKLEELNINKKRAH